MHGRDTRATINTLEVIGYWLLVIGYWLLVIGYWLLVVHLNCIFRAGKMPAPQKFNFIRTCNLNASELICPMFLVSCSF
ncbi:hypothetical protein [Microcoleus sp. PH2017_28_MFU_U_A]|uniref:hypothetical protein n=1 Tax=Microcoleus sp. PH2017_28_MFU_U_A TaxID=2798838 RepID=UPI003FA56A58